MPEPEHGTKEWLLANRTNATLTEAKELSEGLVAIATELAVAVAREDLGRISMLTRTVCPALSERAVLLAMLKNAK